MCWQAISSRQLLLLESIVLARFGRYRIETSTFIFFSVVAGHICSRVHTACYMYRLSSYRPLNRIDGAIRRGEVTSQGCLSIRMYHPLMDAVADTRWIYLYPHLMMRRLLSMESLAGSALSSLVTTFARSSKENKINIYLYMDRRRHPFIGGLQMVSSFFTAREPLRSFFGVFQQTGWIDIVCLILIN